MTKSIQSTRATSFAVTSMGVYFCLGLTLAMRAETSASQSPATGAGSAVATNAIAIYDGGSIAAGDLTDYLTEPRFQADANQNAPTNATISLEEKTARHLAAVRILVKTVRARGWVGAGWPLESKLIEQRVLAEALADELRRGGQVSEQELAEQYRTNRFKLLGFQTVEAGRIGVSARKHGDKALNRGREALAKIRGGQDFTAVASEYSDLEPSLARKETYPADFWGKGNGIALAELGEGKVSEPLPVADGFELVKVERIYLKGNPSPEEAKTTLRVMLTDLDAESRMGEMTKAAEAAFPVILTLTNPPPSTLNSQPSTNPVLLQCGQLTLTKEEVRGLAVQRGVPNLEDEKMLDIIRRESSYQMQMGELARSMGFDKRPEVQRALRYELDKGLADKARQALLPELAAELTFDEGRIREAYDKKFTATFAPQIQYDVLVVPLGVPANATPDERQAAVTNAQAKADAIIRRARDGAKLEEIAAADPAFQWMPGQSRVVNEGSALSSLVAGLKPGEVAARPYEDFGGYCVLRVSKSDPRRKMPYELAKNYIIQDFRNEGVSEPHRNFESVLLNKYHFAFGPGAAARTRASTSATAAKTNR